MPATAPKVTAGPTRGAASGTGTAGIGNARVRPEQFAPRSPAPGRRCRLATRPIHPARRARTLALLTAEGSAAVGAVGSGAPGAQWGARRSARLSSQPPGARPPNHRGAEGAERPARAPAGGAPRGPGRGSGRPLLEAPPDSPGVGAQSQPARSRRSLPEF